MSVEDRQQNPTDESVGTLVSQTARQLGQLARDEIRLARTELLDQRRNLGFGGGLFGAAGLLACIAVLAFTGTVVAALALAMPVWAAALIVGVAAALAAAVAAMLGKKQVERVVPAVEGTVDNVKADLAAIKDGGRR